MNGNVKEHRIEKDGIVPSAPKSLTNLTETGNVFYVIEQPIKNITYGLEGIVFVDYGEVD